MPPNGSRVITEWSCHSVIRGAMPDASVPSETRTPTTSTTWCGFGRGRRFTDGKLLRRKVRAATGERSEVGGAGVLLAQPAREAREQLLREAGVVEQLVEGALADLGDLEVGIGDHARVARRAVEQREVAEEPPGAEHRHLPA